MLRKPQWESAVPVVTCRHSGWVSSCKLIIWYLPLFFKETEGIFSFCVYCTRQGWRKGRWDLELKENNDDLWEVSYARANSACDWAGSSRAARTVGLPGCRTGGVIEEEMRWVGGGCCPSCCQDMLRTSSHNTDMRLKSKKHKNGINY